MGQSEPITPPSKSRADRDSELAPGCAWVKIDQYRLNQPHDRRSQAVARN